MAYTCLELTEWETSEFKSGFHIAQLMADLLREKIVPKKVLSITDHDNKTTIYENQALIKAQDMRHVVCDENDR